MLPPKACSLGTHSEEVALLHFAGSCISCVVWSTLGFVSPGNNERYVSKHAQLRRRLFLLAWHETQEVKYGENILNSREFTPQVQIGLQIFSKGGSRRRQTLPPTYSTVNFQYILYIPYVSKSELPSTRRLHLKQIVFLNYLCKIYFQNNTVYTVYIAVVTGKLRFGVFNFLYNSKNKFLLRCSRNV